MQMQSWSFIISKQKSYLYGKSACVAWIYSRNVWQQLICKAFYPHNYYDCARTWLNTPYVWDNKFIKEKNSSTASTLVGFIINFKIQQKTQDFKS